MSYLFPAFVAFAKPIDKPAKRRCQLKALGLQISRPERHCIDGRPTAQFEVEQSRAYKRVIVPAFASRQHVQIGVVFADGERMLFTGPVEPVTPKVSPGMVVLECFRMLVMAEARTVRGEWHEITPW